MVYLFEGSVDIIFLISVMLMIQFNLFNAVPGILFGVFAFFVLFFGPPEYSIICGYNVTMMNRKCLFWTRHPIAKEGQAQQQQKQNIKKVF